MSGDRERRRPSVLRNEAKQKRQIRLRLIRGDREIAEGKGYDLNEVLAEAARLLSIEGV